MKLICIDGFGRDNLTEGKEYQGIKKDGLYSIKDDNGDTNEFLRDRFDRVPLPDDFDPSAVELTEEQVKDLIQYRGGCNCATMKMPPCSNCTNPLTLEECEYLEVDQ